MSLPSGAIFVDDLSPEFALWDVSSHLPQKGSWKVRDVSQIQHIYVHKSGADGPAGYRGARGMASYCRDHRGWPGAPYHCWLPSIPDEDGTSRYVVYQCLPWSARSYHTGGKANTYGLAVALQGNYDSDWDGVAEIKPSPLQREALKVLVDYWAELFCLDLKGQGPLGKVLSGHWEAPKPKRVCPGDWARDWVLRKRGGPTTLVPPVSAPVWPYGGKVPSVLALQEALKLLGYDPGPIDGIRGYRTRGALEAFQQAQGLEPDGWYGPLTARALTKALGDR
jgi:hypothetical protein